MKKMAIILATGVLFACSDAGKAPVESAGGTVKDSTAKADEGNYPYTASYSSKFEMGDPKNSQEILAIWKDFDNGTLSNSRSRFADSVTFLFADGTSFSGTADSALKMGQQYRDMYSKVNTNVEAWIPLKSTDKNENWVALWGWEHHVDKKGNVDSLHLHEIWRLNNQGKADLVLQFAAQQPQAKKKG